MSTFQPWRKFQPDTEGTPHGWIQWKGTAVCLDFYCKCGAHGHLDDEFCYFVKCGRCGQIYELSGHVEAHPVDAPDPATFDPKVASVDEDPPRTSREEIPDERGDDRKKYGAE